MANPVENEQIQKIEKELLTNGPKAAAAKFKKYLDEQNNTPLNIAITGERGSGKSTFVNAFRGIDNRDERAAPTGCVETTLAVTPYPHPNYPKVTLWDLPGIGSPNFPADKYLKLVGFERFDFFIIISADRFRENDVKLAQEIQRMKKKFYFVRSKIDNNLRDEERHLRSKFNAERTLKQIRDNCIQGLQRHGVQSPQVFLVSSFHLHLYDFPLLVNTFVSTFKLQLSRITMESGQWTEDIKKALENNDLAFAVKMIQEYLDKENNTPLNIAVTGEMGSGKSTFVNAFRGILDEEDERAAPAGFVETTLEVTPYPHPNYANVTLWDLPGIGRYSVDQYLKLVGFERFDFFIIISADRFRENDVKLAQEIQRMGKKFYFVRSKIDNNVCDEERCLKSKFNEERTLQQIRDNCIQGFQRHGVESPQVFLVSSRHLHLYDFTLLVNTFVSTFKLQFSRITTEDPSDCRSTEDVKIARESSNRALAVKMIQEYLDRKKNIPLNTGSTGESGSAKSTFVNAQTKTLESNNQVLAVEIIQEYLDKENNISLNIAITGETGSGKSTFVNAFRGINNGDEGAAPTGPVEMTSKATPYPHPNYPNVTLWDLPAIGTSKFPADNYLKRVGFERFDFFIIISADRFRENDVKLAQEIQRMGRKFYFVRSKIDQNLHDEERRQRSEFNAERCLEQIKENCTQGLQRQGVESPQVFLVSNFDLHLYDFPLLVNTFERELPAHKKDALLLAMSNISLEVINKKKKTFHAQIQYFALLSACVAAAPVPGLSVAVDVRVLVSVVTQYVNGFGLDKPSLQRLADSTHVPYDELLAIIVSPLAAAEITPDLVLKVFSQCAGTAALMTAEEVSRFIPILGIPAAMGLSFISTYRALNTFLDMLAEDAQRVFKKAWVWTPQCDFVR